MEQKYSINKMQRTICLFLLVPLILGIMISGMRASTQALYRAWNPSGYNMEDMICNYEVREEKEERKESEERTVSEIDVARQMARDRVLLGMPENELSHVLCLDDDGIDLALPRADEYEIWYAEVDLAQRKMHAISDTENATVLHTGYIMNKNMKKGYPLKENLEPSGEHISSSNENLYLV